MSIPDRNVYVGPTAFQPDWTGVLAHGSVLADFAYTAAYSGVRTVLTDNPENPPNLQSLHLIEWSWHQGMGALADFACELALGPILLLTGPEYMAPQRKIRQEVAKSCARAGMSHLLTTIALNSFNDLSQAHAVTQGISRKLSTPGVVLTSAGALGEEVASRLRVLGWSSCGLGRSGQGHLKKAVSDVQGVVRHALEALELELRLPRELDCGIESGFLKITE